MPTVDASSNFAPDCQAPEVYSQRPRAITGSGLWEIRIERDISSGQDLVLALDYPYPSDFRVALPNNSSVIRRTKTGDHRDPTWPARLSVIPLPDRLDAGQIIEVCARTSFDKPVNVEIIGADTLRAQSRRETMTQAALMGTLAAMVLAGIGMTFALGNLTFVLIATGLAGALLYFMATQGTVYELPPLARAADIWALHKIGGNLGCWRWAGSCATGLAAGSAATRVASAGCLAIGHGVVAGAAVGAPIRPDRWHGNRR